MMSTQGYGTSGALATQGYPHQSSIVFVILELRTLGVDFEKTSNLSTAFNKLAEIKATMERVIESQWGNISADPPGIPTPSVDIREITGTFGKTSALVAEFEYSGHIRVLMERVIESQAGNISAPAPPTPTPSVDVRELTGMFEKTAGLTIIFDTAGKLKAIFERVSEDRS